MTTLIVGVTTRAIAESARRAGHDVLTIDYFGDLDQKALCPNRSLREQGLRYSAGALVRLARDLSYDAIVYAGGLENHPAAVATLARGRILFGNTSSSLEAVRSPRRLFAALAGMGFSVPVTRESCRELPGVAGWLSKPIRSGGGRGVRVWRGGRLSANRILQEFVEGVPASASFVADGKRSVVLGVTRQLHGPRGFSYAGNIMPLTVSPDTMTEIAAIASGLTRAFALRGVNGYDFVLRGGRPVVLEVNPRYCASMELIERATGLSVFDAHVAACRGRLPGASPAAAPGAWGKRVVYAPRTIRVSDTRAWVQRGVRDVPVPGDTIGRGHPICTVLAEAASSGECDQRLAAAAASVLAECGEWSRGVCETAAVPRFG
jgi:uncharacterized protein